MAYLMMKFRFFMSNIHQKAWEKGKILKRWGKMECNFRVQHLPPTHITTCPRVAILLPWCRWSMIKMKLYQDITRNSSFSLIPISLSSYQLAWPTLIILFRKVVYGMISRCRKPNQWVPKPQSNPLFSTLVDTWIISGYLRKSMSKVGMEEDISPLTSSLERARPISLPYNTSYKWPSICPKHSSNTLYLMSLSLVTLDGEPRNPSWEETSLWDVLGSAMILNGISNCFSSTIF